MFFNKKSKSIIKCIELNSIYKIDERSGNNVRSYEYQFSIIEPENKRILYLYSDELDLYTVNNKYEAIINNKDGSFKIKGPK